MWYIWHRWLLWFHFYQLDGWDLLWFSWSSTYGAVNYQTSVSAYTASCHWRYLISYVPFSTWIILTSQTSVLVNAYEILMGSILLVVATGFLSSMGNAGTWFNIGKIYKARPSRDCCRASLLLSNCASPSCWWQIHFQDSPMGVSFFVLSKHTLVGFLFYLVSFLKNRNSCELVQVETLMIVQSQNSSILGSRNTNKFTSAAWSFCRSCFPWKKLPTQRNSNKHSYSTAATNNNRRSGAA